MHYTGHQHKKKGSRAVVYLGVTAGTVDVLGVVAALHLPSLALPAGELEQLCLPLYSAGVKRPLERWKRRPVVGSNHLACRA